MHRGLLALALASSMGLAVGRFGAASADSAPADPCFSAPVEGQKLQREGRLIEARDRFASCARNTCPAEIVTDCSRWMSEVEAASPSVVVAVRDAQRRDILDVRVSVDGKPSGVVSSRAMALDPGAHTFVFQRPGSPDVTVDVLLREGEKNREVAASLDTSAGASVGAASPPGEAWVAERPVPASAWIAGGFGVLGLAGFATFGALGIGARGTDHCDTGCTQSQKEAVDSKYTIANVSLGVGVLALGAAAWLYLTRPAIERPASAFVDVRALPGGAFAAVGSTF